MPIYCVCNRSCIGLADVRQSICAAQKELRDVFRGIYASDLFVIEVIQSHIAMIFYLKTAIKNCVNIQLKFAMRIARKEILYLRTFM